MKKIFLLPLAVFATLLLTAQPCTTTGFDVCSGGSTVVTNFINATQVTGTGAALSVGAKYKFDNVTTISALSYDAIITIDAIVNATLSGALNPNIDDDNAANETGTNGTQSALFAPRIAPDQTLSCTDRTGYVEFTVRFYLHYSGNGAPPTAAVALNNLNFLHFDMDGGTQGNNGYFKEIGYVKVIAAGNPTNVGGSNTELTNGGNVGGWLLTRGSSTERDGVSRCAEVIEKTIYTGLQSSISFRMGYEYKAPSSNCNSISIQPTRQYGSKFGCFTLPGGGGPLATKMKDLTVTYNAGNATLSWTSLQETNVFTYEILRSFDGVDFKPIGQVKATAASQTKEYKYVDNVTSFTSKFIFYKIKMIDIDYSAKLSNVVSIKTTDWNIGEMIIAPNPSSNDAQLKFKVNAASKADIVVYDALGKVILKQQANIQVGNNSVIVNDITKLSNGYYTVCLTTATQTFKSRLLVLKP
jgi:Secretion system C-terminal sorting domain